MIPRCFFHSKQAFCWLRFFHPSKHSSWWRRLNGDGHILINHTSSRRLGQDQYIRLVHTSSRRLQDVFKTSSRRLQDVFKTSSRRLAKTSSRHLQDVLPRRLQDVFKTSSRRLANTSWRHLQDVLKTYHQVKLFLLTSLWEVFNMFVRRTAKTIVYRRIHLGHTSEKFMVTVQNLQEW